MKKYFHWWNSMFGHRQGKIAVGSGVDEPEQAED
jgi:hypothetical protein